MARASRCGPGRFPTPPAPEARALGRSARLRRPPGAPRRRRLDRARARARGRRAPDGRGRRRARGRARRGRPQIADGDVRVRRRRRGRAFRDRARRHRRLGDLGPGSTRAAVATTWSSPTSGCGCSAADGRDRRGVTDACSSGRSSTRAREHADDGHARHDARPSGAARHARAPSARRTRGRCCATSSGSTRWASRAVHVAARRGRARDVDAGARSRRGGRAAGVRAAPFENSIDAVIGPRLRPGVPGGRGDLRRTHLSRLAADLARWTDPALGWAELDEAYTTGLEHDAAEAEPRHRGARAGEGGAGRRRLRRA